MFRILLMLLICFVYGACSKQNENEYSKITEIGEGNYFVLKTNKKMIKIESKRSYKRNLTNNKNSETKKLIEFQFYLLISLEPFLTIENYKLAKDFQDEINSKKRIVLKDQVHNYMTLRLPVFFSELGSYYLIDRSEWPTAEQDLKEIKKLIEYFKANYTFYDEYKFPN